MNGLAVPEFWNLKPVTRVKGLFGLIAMLSAVMLLDATTVIGKFADAFGVFVPPCTWSVIAFVLGIVTVDVQDTVPVQVNNTVSPLVAEVMTLLTAEAEQSLGPTVRIRAPA
jgi:membrane-bound metal-dependent hydrolase YbcI (DUF457 family)